MPPASFVTTWVSKSLLTLPLLNTISTRLYLYLTLHILPTLPLLSLHSTSSPDPPTTPFESGMPRRVLQSAILSRGTLTWCGPLPTLPMGSTSSPDPPTTPFESGMPGQVLQSAILSRGTLGGCNLLLPLPMGSIVSPDPMTAPLELGILRLILQLASHSGSILTRSSLLHTPLTRSTLFLSLMPTLPMYWTHIHIHLSDLPLVTQRVLVFMQSPTRMVCSRTQKVVYYTGYLTNVVKACIHLPS